MDEKLLSLPWQIQVALGAGYLAYLVAYSGIRDHHKGIDVPFRAIAFGLVATLLIYSTASWRVEYSILASCAGTVVAGALWRAFGRPIYKGMLRYFHVSWSDDTPSAWSALALENTKHRITQISVRLNDGSRLHCTQMHKVGDYPFGPAILGNNGDIAMYVDCEDTPAKDRKDYSDQVKVEGWGANITFIPANQIQLIEIRFLDASGQSSAKILTRSTMASVGVAAD